VHLLGRLQRLLVGGEVLKILKINTEGLLHPGHFRHSSSSSPDRGEERRWGRMWKSPRHFGNWPDYLADGAGLLGAEVEGLVILARVELPQVVLLLLVHDDVNAGDGLPDDADLGELGGGSSSHLGDAKLSELGLEIIELLGEVFLLLLAKLGALDLTHPV